MIAVVTVVMAGDVPTGAPRAMTARDAGSSQDAAALSLRCDESNSSGDFVHTVAWESDAQLRRLPPASPAVVSTVRRLPSVSSAAAARSDLPALRIAAQIRGPAQNSPPPSKAPAQPLPPPVAGDDPRSWELERHGPADWWAAHVARPLRTDVPTQAVSVEMLVLEALRHSPQIQALSDRPVIQETALLEAAGAFDFVAFAESRFDRASDPVGDLLTTGGPPRFRQVYTTLSSGLRKTTVFGSQFEIEQQLGLKNNNSRFFVPTQQGSARLVLGFEQPLLSGAGRAYNRGAIVLAQISSEMAWDDFIAELNQYLVDVADAYWELYRSRAAYLQKQRWHQQASEILAELESRREIDALNTQLARARAAVAARRSELVRAAAEVSNAQTRIHALVYDRPIQHVPPSELIPTESPGSQFVPVALDDALVTAMQHRPEVDRAMQEIEASRVRLNLSRNELLPALDFVAETYVAGLQGDWELGRAYADQFSRGEPGYSVGLVFEYPLGNRAATARYTRRQLEQRRLVKEFQATVQMLQAEVEIAVREVETAYGELQGRREAMQAARVDVQYLTERWRWLPGDDRSASFLLSDLLDAQDRLALEQNAYLDAQVAYSLALLELKRKTGTLLQSEQIDIRRGERDGLPALLLDKPPVTQPHVP
jgi:outer membrane protein TolC